MAAVAWYARGHVLRPIRIFTLLAVAGTVAAVAALAGSTVPRAVLGMSAALALAASVNRRLTRRPRRPLVRRAAWIAAAAVMFAALPGDVPRDGGVFAETYTTIDIATAVVAFGLVGIVMIRIVRGILADRDDRLLVGALGGLGVYVAMWADALPIHSAVWNYAFWILLGAAEARAYGNIRRP